jgi:hypothetical protein
MASRSQPAYVQSAIELLPAAGQWMDFDEYKAKLYLANPQNGRDVFAHLLKGDLIDKKMQPGKDGKPQVVVGRKAQS